MHELSSFPKKDVLRKFYNAWIPSFQSFLTEQKMKQNKANKNEPISVSGGKFAEQLRFWLFFCKEQVKLAVIISQDDITHLKRFH